MHLFYVNILISHFYAFYVFRNGGVYLYEGCGIYSSLPEDEPSGSRYVEDI